MELKLGLQLWSVRNALNKDFAGTLEKIAEIGYTDIQINSSKVTPEGMVFGQDIRAAEVRKYLDKFGLRAPSVHFIPTPDMNLETIVEDLKVLGADSVACAVWFWSNKQEVLDWIPVFNKYGGILKKSGIQLYYHNHFHEFQVFDGKSIYEMVIDGLDKDLIMFEFDTYWSVRGGQDPIYWMKKLGTRCNLVHQKDMPATTKPVILFEKFGYDAIINIDTLWKTQDASHFTEVGDGILNVPGYIRAARQYNQAKYIFIEQDMTSKTELESIAVSFQRMNKLMSEN
jgi:sugar phosphate isomerase/epimerase